MIKLTNNKRFKDDIESVPIDTKSLFLNREPIIKSVKINYNLRYANKKTSIQDHLNRLVYHFPTINSLGTWRSYSIIDSSYVGSKGKKKILQHVIYSMKIMWEFYFFPELKFKK